MARAIIIYGPPGAGKGTQAELLARNYGFIHFDTGRYLESLFRSPAVENDLILKREKENFDTGKLCTPEWILKITKDEAVRLASAGFDVAFSGSPRTMFEAFGDEHTEGLLATLGTLWGKERVGIVSLAVGDAASIERNSHREVCSVCGLPKLGSAAVTQCVFCAAPLRTRSLDTVEVIKVRLEEFLARTLPIVARAKREGFAVFELDGEPLPYVVHKRLVQELNLIQ